MKRLAGIAAMTAAAAIAGAASAQAPAGQPKWLRTPGAQAFQTNYPFRARNAGKAGHAVIACTADAKGGLTGCSVVAEDPEGFGFGPAALKLARYFKMAPKKADGSSVEGMAVQLPIAFSLGDSSGFEMDE